MGVGKIFVSTNVAHKLLHRKRREVGRKITFVRREATFPFPFCIVCYSCLYNIRHDTYRLVNMVSKNRISFFSKRPYILLSSNNGLLTSFGCRYNNRMSIVGVSRSPKMMKKKKLSKNLENLLTERKQCFVICKFNL